MSGVWAGAPYLSRWDNLIPLILSCPCQLLTTSQVVITKRLLSQLYGQTDAALASLSSSLLARQACRLLFSCFLLSLPPLLVFLHLAKAVDLFYFAPNVTILRKATLCKELLQTVAKVDSGFSQFRLSKIFVNP